MHALESEICTSTDQYTRRSSSTLYEYEYSQLISTAAKWLSGQCTKARTWLYSQPTLVLVTQHYTTIASTCSVRNLPAEEYGRRQAGRAYGCSGWRERARPWLDTRRLELGCGTTRTPPSIE